MYEVLVYCSDCRYSDPEGCFGGGDTRIAINPEGRYSLAYFTRDEPASFASVQEAIAAAHTLDIWPPYAFQVLDEELSVVYDSRYPNRHPAP